MLEQGVEADLVSLTLRVRALAQLGRREQGLRRAFNQVISGGLHLSYFWATFKSVFGLHLRRPAARAQVEMAAYNGVEWGGHVQQWRGRAGAAPHL